MLLDDSEVHTTIVISPLERRFGRFLIEDFYIKQKAFHPKLLEVFSNVVVVRAESRYDRCGIEYIGLSELFDVIPAGEIIPEYRMIIDEDQLNGSMRVRSERLDPPPKPPSRVINTD